MVGVYLNTDIHLLSTWIRNSKMHFNLEKSSVMWFSEGSKHADAQPQTLIDDHPLSRVAKQKCLGVIFNKKLNWSSHVRGCHL